jgi:metal-responsive CopG/Arc/MetJ family transcriptional regulator
MEEVSVQIDRDTLTEIEKRASDEGCSRSAVFREILTRGLTVENIERIGQQLFDQADEHPANTSE